MKPELIETTHTERPEEAQAMDDQGWCEPDDFDDPVRDGVRAELAPGESLLWAERPTLPRVRRVRLIPLAFVVVLTSLSGVSLAGMLGVLNQAVLDPWVILAAFGLAPAALGGMIVFDVLQRAVTWGARRWTLARTVYAMTDQRVIIGRFDPSDGRVDAYSIIPGMIADTTPFEYADGTGDLHFEGLGAIARGPVGFFGIRRVRDVDLLLRETLIDPFPRW